MLHVFLKTTLLLFSLWIDSLKADEWTCNQQLTMIDSKTAVCKIEHAGSIHTYHCDYASCWTYNHQWVSVPNCQLFGSKDKSFSTQQCSHYQYIGSGIYKCWNPSNVPYLCLWQDTDKFIALGCTSCQEKD